MASASMLRGTRVRMTVLLGVMALLAPAGSSWGASTAGTACKKVNATKVVAGRTFVCRANSAKKLVWTLKVANRIASPSATPTASAAGTSSSAFALPGPVRECVEAKLGSARTKALQDNIAAATQAEYTVLTACGWSPASTATATSSGVNASAAPSPSPTPSETADQRPSTANRTFPPMPNVTLPKLTIIGAVPGGEANLRNEWAAYYPLMVKYGGMPFSFDRTGVIWVWETDVSKPDSLGWLSDDNSVHTGPIPDLIRKPNFSYMPPAWQAYQSFEHETGHLMLNTMPQVVIMEFGQWIWEAHTLVLQSLAYMEQYGDYQTCREGEYDTIAYLGKDVVNGVMRDGSKPNRSMANASSTCALLMMTEVLAPTTLDLVAQINAGLKRIIESTGSPRISAAQYKALLNEVGGSRRIDGLPAGEWLFSQPVANTSGALGPFAQVQMAYGMLGTKIGTISGGAFDRELKPAADGTTRPGDVYEYPFVDAPVKLEIIDAGGVVRATGATVTDAKGAFTVQAQQAMGLEPSSLPAGAYRVRATVSTSAGALTTSNVFIDERIYRKSDSPDPCMYLILVNQDGSIHASVDGVTVTGGKVEATFPGAIRVSATPGATVSVTSAKGTVHISKPMGTRIVPVRVG